MTQLDGLEDDYGPIPTPAPSYPPRALVEAMEPMSLRAVARRLQVDPAMLCRPLTSAQADRYATRLGLHPVEVWGSAWARPGVEQPAVAWLDRPEWEREAILATAHLDDPLHKATVTRASPDPAADQGRGSATT